MLALVLGSSLIFFLLVTFGDLSLKIFNRFFSVQVSYNLLDKYLLGLGFLLIPLQLWSIFLPSGVLFLTIIFLFALGYSLLERKRIYLYLNYLQSVLSSLSWWQCLMIGLFILSVFLSSVWIDHSYDAEFYHYQNMLWIENYAVVPGLGNWEDRFGFNSNYFLFGAIFSFNKGLLGEPLFAFNISFFIPLFVWVLVKFFTNLGDPKFLALLLITSILLLLNLTRITNSSTDFLPNILAFYLFSSILLDKDVCKKKLLLFYLAPVLLLTFKLSMAPLAVFCLLSLYFCFKEQEYNKSLILLIWSILALVLWLTRNVILTGYLVYPIYQIDLFSFDWKMPKELAMMQANYIRELPILGWKVFAKNPIDVFLTRQVDYFIFSLSFVMLIVALISLLNFIFRLVFRKYIPTLSELVFWLVGVITLLLGLTSGFDLRFIFGVIFAFAMAGCINLLSVNFNHVCYKFGLTWIFVLILSYSVWSARKFYSKYYIIYYWESRRGDLRPAYSSLLMPFPNYVLSDITMNLTKKGEGLVNAVLTETNIEGYRMFESRNILSVGCFPVAISYGQSAGRFIDYKCVRLRGGSFQEGFKMDYECFEKSTNLKYGYPYQNKWLQKE